MGLFFLSSLVRVMKRSDTVSKDLRKKYGVRSIPIRRDDEVMVVRGRNRVTGKVTSCYRRKFVVYVENLTREKINKQIINVGVHPSNCVITKLKLDKDRLELFNRKKVGGEQNKGKATQADVSA